MFAYILLKMGSLYQYLSLSVFSMAFLTMKAQPKQNIFENTTISAQAHYGTFITSVPKALYLKDSYSDFAEIRISKPVQNVFFKNLRKLPDWGVAVLYGNTGSRKYMGSMTGIFPFINFKFLAAAHFSSSVTTGFGAAFVEKPYNLESNHKNVLIGSRGNVFIQLLWKNELQIAKRVFVNAGISFNHLSNGNTSLPNLGLNIPAFTTGIAYALYKEHKAPVLRSDTVKAGLSYCFNISFGLKQSPWINSPRYGTAILEGEILKEPAGGKRYGGGLALFYDPAQNHLYLDTIVTLGKTNKPAFNAGPYVTYEKILGKFSIPLKLGLYFFPSEAGLFFQDLGFRYQLNHHLSMQASLLAHWGKADFIHGGFSYQL